MPESVSAAWQASGPVNGQVVQASPSQTASSDPLGATSLAEQVKTILAVIGLLAILFCGLRLLSLAQAPGAR